MKAPPIKPRRAHWEILPAAGKAIGWVVERNGTKKCRFFFQFRAIAYAVAECKRDLEEFDIRSELVIHNRQGRIRDKRTYGDDPRQIKG